MAISVPREKFLGAFEEVMSTIATRGSHSSRGQKGYSLTTTRSKGNLHYNSSTGHHQRQKSTYQRTWRHHFNQRKYLPATRLQFQGLTTSGSSRFEDFWHHIGMHHWHSDKCRQGNAWKKLSTRRSDEACRTQAVRSTVIYRTFNADWCFV